MAIFDPRGSEIVGTIRADVLVAGFGATTVRRDPSAKFTSKDTLYAIGEGDTLLGGRGSDLLYSGDGRDTLEGGRPKRYGVLHALQDRRAGGP